MQASPLEITRPTLSQLGTLYGTDKVNHHYTDFYPSFMEPFRDHRIRVMEVGVFYGASIRMWRDYFPHATIVAVDWFTGIMGNKSSFENAQSFVHQAKNLDRVIVENCDQHDRPSLNKLAAKYDQATFQFIIDDGSHLSEDQQQTLAALWPLVAPGGAFVIEDVCCSLHANEYDNLPDFSNTTLTMLDNFVATKKLKSLYMQYSELFMLEQQIDRVEFFWKNNTRSPSSGTVVLYKKPM